MLFQYTGVLPVLGDAVLLPHLALLGVPAQRTGPAWQLYRGGATGQSVRSSERANPSQLGTCTFAWAEAARPASRPAPLADARTAPCTRPAAPAFQYHPTPPGLAPERGRHVDQGIHPHAQRLARHQRERRVVQRLEVGAVAEAPEHLRARGIAAHEIFGESCYPKFKPARTCDYKYELSKFSRNSAIVAEWS